MELLYTNKFQPDKYDFSDIDFELVNDVKAGRGCIVFTGKNYFKQVVYENNEDLKIRDWSWKYCSKFGLSQFIMGGIIGVDDVYRKVMLAQKPLVHHLDKVYCNNKKDVKSKYSLIRKSAHKYDGKKIKQVLMNDAIFILYEDGTISRTNICNSNYSGLEQVIDAKFIRGGLLDYVVVGFNDGTVKGFGANAEYGIKNYKLENLRNIDDIVIQGGESTRFFYLKDGCVYNNRHLVEFENIEKIENNNNMILVAQLVTGELVSDDYTINEEIKTWGPVKAFAVGSDNFYPPYVIAIK